MLKVVIGSKNPVKINATEQAFESAWPDCDFEFISVEVDSGVSNQPMTQHETVHGARNRAQRALELTEADFGVGIEGGLEEHGNSWFDATWVVVVDRKGREGVGSTVWIPVPDKFVEEIKSGKELGEVIDNHFDGENLAKKQGFFGLMTENHITRTSGYEKGVISALVPFLNEDLFEWGQ